MQSVQFKRGGTFNPTVRVLDGAGDPFPLTGWGIESSVKSSFGGLVATLSVVDRNDSAGTYGLQSATATWPVDTHLWDIKYTDPDGNVRQTSTIAIELVQEIT